MSVTVPDGWLPSATIIAEPAPPEVVAGAELDDCVELEPHAATDAATTAATAMNRMEINLCVLIFKIPLPRRAGALVLTAGPDDGTVDLRCPSSRPACRSNIEG